MADDDRRDIENLASDDPRLVAAAAQRIAKSVQPRQSAAVPLAKQAGIGNEEAQEWITAALEELGPPAAADLPLVADLLSAYLRGDYAADVGYWSATLLGRAGELSATYVDVLEACTLQAKHLSVRERAIWALRKLGTAAASAKATLEQLAQDPAPRISRLAQRALAGLAGRES